MQIVVMGGSAAGQFVALLLARAGHAVVLLDRDDVSPAADADAAAMAAFRPTAPHIVHPHALLPRCRLLLRQHLPDVYDALLAAGAVEAPLPVATPPGVHLDSRPGDDDYTAIATRRSTFDLILRRAIADQAGITCRFATRVSGLLADQGAPPRVRGVQTDVGAIAADLVIDATGRRTRIDSWLTDIGSAATELVSAECGLCYRSRHYRVRPGHELPGHPASRLLLALDEFTTGLWNCDNGTALIALAPLVEDHRFRGVDNGDVFDAVAATVPAYRPWLDCFEPVSDVFVMAGLHNTWRRLVVDGEVRATGLALVGDSRCTTNPTFGRGLTLALLEAVDLVSSVEIYGYDLMGLAYRLEQLANEHVEPFYLDQAHNDSMRLAALRQTIFGIEAPPPTRRPDAVSFAELRAAMAANADAVRAFWRVMGMLELPNTVYTDPQVVDNTRDALRNSTNFLTIPQPTRAELEATLTGADPRR
jgi:2-polyprenyl-6-methoxyphenol hydroxylase-like FAD-dependent oxidoreductase